MSSQEKLLVSFDIDGGYGSLSGLFIAEASQLNFSDERGINCNELYFGEVLGKHSEVSFVMSDDYLNIVSRDQALIKQLETIFGSKTLSGYNPVEMFEQQYKKKNK